MVTFGDVVRLSQAALPLAVFGHPATAERTGRILLRGGAYLPHPLFEKVDGAVSRARGRRGAAISRRIRPPPGYLSSFFPV